MIDHENLRAHVPVVRCFERKHLARVWPLVLAAGLLACSEKTGGVGESATENTGPTGDEPTGDGPAVADPAAADPASDDPTGDDPASDQSMLDEPEPPTIEPDPGDPGQTPPVTWHGQIAPLVHRSCGGCHVEDGIAPLSLLDYASAWVLAPLMVEAVETGAMPPWGAQETEECEPPHAWKDDLRLTDDEKALLAQWLADGTPEGDPADAEALPEPPSLTLPEPTATVTIGTEVVIDGNEDEFHCFSVDPGLTEDVWLTSTQVNAGNASIVHHVLVYADPEGQSLGLAGDDGSYPCFGGPGIDRPQLVAAWAPGAIPASTPSGVALPLSAGTRLVVNVHYHPTGTPETDSSTSVDLKYSTTQPDATGMFLLVGNFGSASGGLLPGPNDRTSEPEFRIPAGVSDHVETQRVEVNPLLARLGTRVWAVGTHMHLIGRDMRMTFERADGTEQCLIQTPDWDFDWQRSYYYDVAPAEALSLEEGDVLSMRCTYDNTLNNRGTREALADQGLEAPIDVVLGEGSLDEMCLGVFGIAIPGVWAVEDIIAQL